MQTEQQQSTVSTPENSKIPRNPGRRWPLWAGIGVIAALLVAILGFFGLNAALDGQYSGKIEPGVSISGVYVGEMTRDQAKTAVLKQLAGYTQKPVVLSFKDQTWQPPLDELGISINLEASLDKALNIGHDGGFFKDARLFKLISPQSQNLPIEVQLDESKLHGFLDTISNRIRKDTVEPEIKLDPEGKLVVTEGKEGFNVDFEATYQALKTSLSGMTPSDENLLKVSNVPPVITPQEVTELQTSLMPLLTGPVTLTFQDKTWNFSLKQIAEQIKITRNNDPKAAHHLGYTLNTDYFQKFVTGLAKEINQDPKDAEPGFKDGQVVFVKASQDGRLLSVGRTMDNLNQALLATEPEKRKTSLWVDVKEPSLSSSHPEKLGNFDVLGEGVSSFSGSAYERSTNIKVGASYLTQTLIKPHSVFSFLDSVGEISPKRGYVKGYAIVADQTVPDVGGGICQVSTTTFRAAFWAGLPIVERNPHAYRVSWYEEMDEPVGFDAAVYQPGVDFKFENPTDYYMAVVAFPSNGRLYVRILGNKVPGQKVEMVPGPITNVTNPPPDKMEVDPTLSPGQRKQVDSAHKGLNTNITRVIKVDGKETQRDVYYTRFAAWPNIFKVGPEKKPVPTTPAGTIPANGTTGSTSALTPGATTPAPSTPGATTTTPAPKPTQPPATPIPTNKP